MLQLPDELSLALPPLSSSIANFSHYLVTDFHPSSGETYSALCHRPSAINLSNEEELACFTTTHKSLTQTLSFKHGMRDDWVAALMGEHHHNTLFTDESGISFEVDSGKLSSDTLAIGQMRNGKWVAYAARALVIRFWDLAKVRLLKFFFTKLIPPPLSQKADSLDILLILAGYILMHTTFYLLLRRSRNLGSSFWLPLAIVSSAVLALLIALPIAMALKIPIDPVALTEALPFLVCTVGFDKPLRLARAVFGHEHLLLPPGVEASNAPLAVPSFTSSPHHHQLKPAPKIITESLSLVYPPIIRDYILEIAVLTVGAYSKVGGLKEVCALAALILTIDCLLLCTYLAAILGVMVEVSGGFNCLFLFDFALRLTFAVLSFAFNLHVRGFTLLSVLFLD